MRRKHAHQKYALIIEVLLRTRLRLGECPGLRFGDVDFDAGVLAVHHSCTKDGHLGPVKTASSNRRVPLTPELLKQLATRSLELEADDETFVFVNRRGAQPMSQTKFRRRGWNPAVKAAGLDDGPHVTPHDARHAFAPQRADIDLTSSDVAPILGHVTAGITESTYLHAFNREAREERDRKAMAIAMSGTLGRVHSPQAKVAECQHLLPSALGGIPTG